MVAQDFRTYYLAVIVNPDNQPLHLLCRAFVPKQTQGLPGFWRETFLF